MVFVKHALRVPGLYRRAFLNMLDHDGLNLAQSAAYSAMVALFPALVVVAACIALLPNVAPLRIEVGEFFDQVLPTNVFPLLTAYFVTSAGAADGRPHTARALTLAALVSLTGASSVIATLMEGLRRAADLPPDCWNFAQRRIRAFALVPVSLLPLVVATMLVVFGRLITEHGAAYLPTSARPAFFGAALAIRWTVALAGVVGLTALIYHMGTPAKVHWLRTLPGAVMATGMWFVSTLVFGWYVTRVANYSAVYGSLGAGIALLFWLYIVFLSVLCGAEFNALVDRVETAASPFQSGIVAIPE